MVFSIDTIRSSFDNKVDNINESSSNDIIELKESSIFVDSLPFILEEDINISRSISSLIYESNIVTELAGKAFKAYLKRIDPWNIIRKIFEGFYKILEMIVNALKKFIVDTTNSSLIIKTYSNKIKSIKTPVTFYQSCYDYTNLDASTPSLYMRDVFDKQYSFITTNLEKLSTKTSNKRFDLLKSISDIKNEIEVSDDIFDNLRGELINSTHSISKNDFLSELFVYFRGSAEPYDKGYFKPEEIYSILNSWEDKNKFIRKTEKDKNDIIKYSKECEGKISSIKLENFVDDDIDKDTQQVFTALLSNSCNRIKECCDIFRMYFTVKIDAIKDKYSQDTKILIEAIHSIIDNKGGSNND